MDNLKLLRQNNFLTNLQGKEYVTHAGLLWLAHQNGIESLEVSIVSWIPEERAAVASATAKGARGTYTDIGDADPSNVSRNIATACLRMASTRASSRCLRLYLGVGMTALEELPSSRREVEPTATARIETPAPDKQHHASANKKAIARFHARLKEIGGYDYKIVKDFCEYRGQPAPFELPEDRRVRLLGYLETSEGREDYKSYCKDQV
jgi:hypothetical protein